MKVIHGSAFIKELEYQAEGNGRNVNENDSEKLTIAYSGRKSSLQSLPRRWEEGADRQR